MSEVILYLHPDPEEIAWMFGAQDAVPLPSSSSSPAATTTTVGPSTSRTTPTIAAAATTSCEEAEVEEMDLFFKEEWPTFMKTLSDSYLVSPLPRSPPPPSPKTRHLPPVLPPSPPPQQQPPPPPQQQHRFTPPPLCRVSLSAAPLYRKDRRITAVVGEEEGNRRRRLVAVMASGPKDRDGYTMALSPHAYFSVSECKGMDVYILWKILRFRWQVGAVYALDSRSVKRLKETFKTFRNDEEEPLHKIQLQRMTIHKPTTTTTTTTATTAATATSCCKCPAGVLCHRWRVVEGLGKFLDFELEHVTEIMEH